VTPWSLVTSLYFPVPQAPGHCLPALCVPAAAFPAAAAHGARGVCTHSSCTASSITQLRFCSPVKLPVTALSWHIVHGAHRHGRARRGVFEDCSWGSLQDITEENGFSSGVSRLSQQLFPLVAQASQGRFHPSAHRSPSPLPEKHRAPRRQQGCGTFLQQTMGRRGRGERRCGCNGAGRVASRSSPKPAPLIDLSGWEAGSLRRAFDIKGVFTPPLHQSKLELICAYTLLLK